VTKHFTKASLVGALVALSTIFVAAFPGASASPRGNTLPSIPESCRFSQVGALEVSETGGLGRIEFHGKIGAVLQRDEGTVAMLDVSNPARPKRIGEYADGITDSFDGDLTFSEDGKWLLYARQTHQFSKDGIHVLDVSDPASPTLMNYQPTGGAYRIEYLKDKDGAEWVFLLDAVHGLVVYRFESTTGQLVPVAIDALPALKVGGPASAGFFIEKARMYVTTGETGLQIYDISDPMQPVILGEWGDVGLAEIEVRGNTAYAATEYWFDASLKPEVVVLDVKKPAAIKERDRLYFGGTAMGGERVQGMALMPHGGLLVAHSGLGLISPGPGEGCDVRPKGKANTGAGVTGSPYSMDVEIGPGGDVYLTDAATGTLSVLSYRFLN
jgi:LVIVD repeat